MQGLHGDEGSGGRREALRDVRTNLYPETSNTGAGSTAEGGRLADGESATFYPTLVKILKEFITNSRTIKTE